MAPGNTEVHISTKQTGEKNRRRSWWSSSIIESSNHNIPNIMSLQQQQHWPALGSRFLSLLLK
ncbi:hypothetical protein DERP_006338 [Dermatophagoides pteronyssinus]|uniref:Uncharacterized protein n=1 Tax=Dermatophagoides pteronyssinus TaxID=6956 RepID=A0ABQ8IY62_DERPT|nr:hypothetical protein DERP_006338 [Dermatophagoides pteronyssinus]